MNKKEFDETLQKDIDQILSLKDDWDDEGSPAYNEDFVKEIAEFLRKTFTDEWLKFHLYHGPDGSLDLLFDEKNIKLLMNFNKNGNSDYYGYSKNHSVEIQENFNFRQVSKNFISELLSKLTKL
jgi:hypothetical protein